MGRESIVRMVKVSDYLGMDWLFELSCAKVGDYLKDMDMDEFEEKYCN